MIYLIIFVSFAIWGWMLYEAHKAPFIDGDGNIKRKK